MGRHTPFVLPAAAPVGTTQLNPAWQPRQPASPLQPEFCVQAAPAVPSPAHAQSVDSLSYTKQANPGAHPVVAIPVGSQGREHAWNCEDGPHGMGRLQ